MSRNVQQEIRKLLKIRGGHRGYVNRILQTTENVLSEFNKQQSQIDELKSIKVTLIDKKQLLKDFDSKVLDSMDEDDAIEQDINESGELEGRINRFIIKIETCLKTAEQTTSTPSTSNDSQNVHVQNTSSSKLPKLTLNQFGGDPKQWQTFWESYDSAINSNTQLSNVDKFNYLKGLLTGPAAACIAGLSIVDDNYKSALTLLKERFGDKQIVISSHMDSLLNIPSVNTVNDIKGVRSFYDSIEFHVRNLRSLGVDSSSYCSLLISVIVNKLPEELRLCVSRESKSWDIDEFLKVLKNEIEARERVSSLKSQPNSAPNISSTRNQYCRPNFVNKTNFKTQPSTASTLLTSKEDMKPFNRQFNNPICVFCVQQHPSLNCKVVTDIAVRRSILRRKGKCFLCLRSGHRMRDCPKKDYNCFQCGGKHNKAICDNLNSHINQNNQSVTSNISVNSDNSVLLQTAVGQLCNTDSVTNVKANIVFDSCSQRTYVRDKMRRSLNLKTIGRENLLVKAFGEESPRLKSCDVVQLAVKGRDDLLLYLTAYCVPSICSPICDQLTDSAIKNYPYLQGLQLANVSGQSVFDVDLLIGADYYWNFVVGDVRRGEHPGPVAMLTKLGWVLSGPVIKDMSNTCASTNSSVCLVDTHVLHVSVEHDSENTSDSLQNELRRFWELESIGIQQDETCVMTDFIKDIHFNNLECRYEVKLPFKDYHPILADHYSVCVKRLNSLLYRLQKTPDILLEYNNIINDQLQTGVIERIEFDNICNIGPGSVHYIPHREVLRFDKDTTKLRIVYNASCRTESPSLNDCLFAGPSLNPLIFDILLRFRLYPFAVTADIQKAFLNINIVNDHRDFLRFLWVDDPFKESPNIVAYRFNRVVFGVTSSPFILNATIRHHLYTYFDNVDFIQSICKSLYVDDLACGSDSQESLFDICKQLKLCMKTAGFNLRKWKSNSKALMNMFDECKEFEFEDCNSDNVIIEDDSGYSSYLCDTDCNSTNVLGVKWNCDLDTFHFDFSKMLQYIDSFETLTKRIVLSFTAKFFDPLGIISPIVVMFKLYFQNLCEVHIDWDDALDSDFNRLWTKSLNSLRDVTEISFDRCVCKELSDATSIQLHVFADASEKAYGACVYLRCEHNSIVHCNLIASKTRISPIKKQTIPRLELLACLIAARLISCIKDAVFDILDPSVYYWSDSQVALAWIRNSTKEYKQFVNNRVTDIRRLTKTDDWYYCPTKENPADILSRGSAANDLVTNELWWHGPSYLLMTDGNWPKGRNEQIVNDEFLSEVKRTTVCLSETSVTADVEKIIDITRFSTLSKLLRVTAYVLRFVSQIKRRVKSGGTCITDKQLASEEILDADKLWLICIQNNCRKDDKFRQRKQTLNLKPDENGILRCFGRIENSSLSYDCKNPVFIPEYHAYSKLLIDKCHLDVKHNGTIETLVQLRQKFWICRGRQVVRNVIGKCIMCKRLEGKSYGVPQPAPLPGFRLSDTFAFQNVGVDYAGPLYVRDIYSKNPDMYKAFIALYTCASSRAIHLDLVPDASSSSFIRSFKRFIGRRGIPVLMNSDNSLTFKNTDVTTFIQDRNIKWQYNVERSPWWGGYFERLVKSTKRCLKKCLGNAHLTYEELVTLLIDIEGVLNSRPLTYVSDELIEPLTPSHLIIGRRVLSTPSCDIDSVKPQTKASEFQKRQRHMKYVLSHYWKRWRTEYVTGLREYHRTKVKTGPLISEGDVVLIYDDKVSRLNWELAVVEKTLMGKDNRVRAATVRTHDSQGKSVTLNRPVQKLYPLELSKD